MEGGKERESETKKGIDGRERERKREGERERERGKERKGNKTRIKLALEPLIHHQAPRRSIPPSEQAAQIEAEIARRLRHGRVVGHHAVAGQPGLLEERGSTAVGGGFVALLLLFFVR